MRRGPRFRGSGCCGCVRVLCAGGLSRVIPPLGYLDFIALEASARLVPTHSGGVQEETTALPAAAGTSTARATSRRRRETAGCRQPHHVPALPAIPPTPGPCRYTLSRPPRTRKRHPSGNSALHHGLGRLRLDGELLLVRYPGLAVAVPFLQPLLLRQGGEDAGAVLAVTNPTTAPRRGPVRRRSARPGEQGSHGYPSSAKAAVPAGGAEAGIIQAHPTECISGLRPNPTRHARAG